MLLLLRVILLSYYKVKICCCYCGR